MKMSAIALLMLLTIPVLAAETAPNTCVITFHVGATMHSFDGSVTSEPVETTPQGDAFDLKTRVTVTNMTTANKKRDAEMFHMLHADNHAEIVGEARGVNWQNVRDASGAGKPLEFDLTIAGTTQGLAARVENLNETESTVSFDAVFPVSLKAFGLKPPSVIGLIRVHDIVTVKAHFELPKS